MGKEIHGRQDNLIMNFRVRVTFSASLKVW